MSSSLFGLTLLAGSVLTDTKKQEIAELLIGDRSSQDWSTAFTDYFDALFGQKHLSWVCLWRSAVASLIAVTLIWLVFGSIGALDLRAQANLSLGAILVIALAVNIAADYVSLLETRLLLGQMHRLRRVWAQGAVLVADLLISGLIIWAAIFAYLNSPLHQGEIEGFAEIIGVFSIFSVLFYSTFLTSVWSWAYLISTWAIRLCAKLPGWVAVRERPFHILACFVFVTTFLGSLSAAALMQKDADGLTPIDRTLCTLFKGQVCLDVARLTKEEQAQFELLLLACEGGITEECVRHGLRQYEVEPKQAARLFRHACDGGNALGCHILGLLHFLGRGMPADPAAGELRLRQVCDGGNTEACTNLGVFYEQGFRLPADPEAAARLYRQGCDGGNARGCALLERLSQ
ncbi:MAG: tetratricopeptide repeat protein [Alphaproteobacteria bacterium]|nr:tetratricopeptide repeat protein [Alphaproteobacteria bacterium]